MSDDAGASSKVAVGAVGSHIDISALGVPIRLRLGGRSAEALRAGLERAWARSILATDRAPGAVVRADLERISDYRAVMERVTQQVTLAAIEARAGQLLMFHACAIADPTTGAAVLLVGPSGMGKTTLARHLGRHWGYLTDETAGVTSDHSVLAYPKPLSIVASGSVGKDQLGPDELGLLHPGRDTKVAAVVLLDRQPQGAHLADLLVEPVPNVTAIALLAEHTSYLTRLERPLGTMAALLKATGGLRRVSYTDADELLPVVTELLESAP
jgi:hypothetical protein